MTRFFIQIRLYSNLLVKNQDFPCICNLSVYKQPVNKYCFCGSFIISVAKNCWPWTQLESYLTWITMMIVKVDHFLRFFAMILILIISHYLSPSFFSIFIMTQLNYESSWWSLLAAGSFYLGLCTTCNIIQRVTVIEINSF